MTAPIRVLVVDDAVVMRRLLARVLEEDGDVEVTTAANGRLALAKLPFVAPDVVVLDVEMPELDGLATLREIRRRRPRLPVVMFSTLTERGATATLDALAFGASDYVAKPTGSGGAGEAMDRVRAELVPRIRALAAGHRSAPAGELPVESRPAPRRPSPLRPRAGSPVELVVVGSSTGGPRALEDLLAALPGDLSVPVLVAQHMPPMFTRLLADRLDREVALTVREVAEPGPIGAGQVWVAPGDRHLVVRRDGARLAVALVDDPPENACRPAVDVLFRSAARATGGATLAVVLTGMGVDGHRGCEALHHHGATVLVQDEATSVVWGMPGAVARAGLADRLVPIEHMGATVAEIIGRRRDPVGAGRGRGAEAGP